MVLGRKKGTHWSKVCKGYLVSMVGKEYIVDQGWQSVPSGPILAKGTFWPKVG